MLNFFVKAFELKIKFHTDSGLSEPNFERPDLDGKRCSENSVASAQEHSRKT